MSNRLLATLMAGLSVALPAMTLADPSYIYGLHEPGGESNMSGNKGWIVFTEAIGHNPADTGGGNYSAYASAGYGVVVRLNNGYGSAGTIPADTDYANFATRCANFVSHSTGTVLYWIIGNETNLPREWPGNVNGDPATGQPITVARYVNCYNQAYTAIKNIAPNAKVMPTPSGTWAPPFAAQGVEGFVDYWINILNGIGANKIDGIALHCYTHGCDPALVTDNTKMGPPYTTIYYNFRVYRNYLSSLPASLTSKPVLITECDQNIECSDNANPKHTWSNVNNGWVRAIYSETNAWNQANAQKIRCVALFRWPMAVEDVYTFGIQDRNLVITDFQQAVAFGYQWTTGSPPPAPTGLTATPGDAQVGLSWSASAGATSYNVKRSTVSGGPYNTTASPSGTTYTDTGLTNGTTYYYVVSAVNGSGESANSAQTSAMPNGTMNNNTPTGTNVAPASAQVQTDSNFNASFPGTLATDASLSTKWCSNGNAPPHWIALDLGSSKTLNGFVFKMGGAGGEFTSYNFKAFKIQSAGSLAGPWTDEASVDNTAQASIVSRSYITPKSLRYVRMYITDAGIDAFARLYEFEVWASSQVPPAPPAPTGLIATATASGQVSLTWIASTGATGYKVKRSTINGGSYNTVGSPAVTSFTDNGLPNGTIYYYVVSATNAGGESANSTQANATPSSLNFPVVIQRGSGLANVFAKLNGGQSAVIAYIGGSVTQNTGYRDNVTAWFTGLYPGKITQINAGWSGTGSLIGAMRMIRDVLNSNPDLVFVEFAVNDLPEDPLLFVERNSEGIVRQAWALKSTNIDVCFIDTIAYYIESSYLGGQYPTTVQAHNAVGDLYGVPSINVGWQLYTHVLAGTPWTDLAPDRVHPNSTGSAIYSNEAIIPYLNMERTRGASAAPHAIPAALTDYPVMGSTITDMASLSSLSAPWSKQFNQYGVASFIQSSTAGSTVSLTFTGPSAAAKIVVAPDGGGISYSVDGSAFASGNIPSTGSPYLWAFPVAKMSSTSGTHTLTLRVDSGTARIINFESTGSGINPFSKADFDHDSDVDDADFIHLNGCHTGADAGPPAGGCPDADLDADLDVDQSDFGLFQRCLSGSNLPANPSCPN